MHEEIEHASMALEAAMTPESSRAPESPELLEQHRSGSLRPEPFLVVGLIAVTRRILVLTAEMSKLAKETQTGFYNAMIELGLLTVLIIALVLCLRMLRQREPASVEKA